MAIYLYTYLYLFQFYSQPGSKVNFLFELDGMTSEEYVRINKNPRNKMCTPVRKVPRVCNTT